MLADLIAFCGSEGGSLVGVSLGNNGEGNCFSGIPFCFLQAYLGHLLGASSC